MPAGTGSRYRIRLSRRHHFECIRRAVPLSGQDPPCADRSRAGRGPRGGRLRPLHRQGGRVLRHLRSRRDEPDHRHRHRLSGLLTRGVHHLQRGGEPAGQGFLPGSGHHRHRHAHHQGRLPGAGRPDHPRRDAPGLCRGGQRPARPGSDRLFEKCHRRQSDDRL